MKNMGVFEGTLLNFDKLYAFLEQYVLKKDKKFNLVIFFPLAYIF